MAESDFAEMCKDIRLKEIAGCPNVPAILPHKITNTRKYVPLKSTSANPRRVNESGLITNADTV
jgi:hypothetical protein